MNCLEDSRGMRNRSRTEKAARKRSNHTVEPRRRVKRKRREGKKEGGKEKFKSGAPLGEQRIAERGEKIC